MLLKICKDRGDSDSCIRYAAEEFLRFNGLGDGPVTVLREGGKPILGGLPYYVSFSHTDGVKACVVSDKPAGIDVERMKKRDFGAISSRFFAPGEKTSRRYAFYKLWTSKEALKKLTGEPLIEVLKHTDYSRVRHFDFISGVALSVAGEGDFFIVLYFINHKKRKEIKL